MNLLELKDISKIYGSVKALQNIDLQVSQGEWLAIMGPSGSGKTTMMNIIGCMDKPSNGSVILDGMNIAKESAKSLTNIRRDKIGLIFQQFHLINYPMLILADEPTGNLDETNEKIVLDIFKQLHHDGSTIIVVTHDPEVAEEAQRTVVLEHGRISRIVRNEK